MCLQRLFQRLELMKNMRILPVPASATLEGKRLTVRPIAFCLLGKPDGRQTENCWITLVARQTM